MKCWHLSTRRRRKNGCKIILSVQNALFMIADGAAAMGASRAFVGTGFGKGAGRASTAWRTNGALLLEVATQTGQQQAAQICRSAGLGGYSIDRTYQRWRALISQDWPGAFAQQNKIAAKPRSSDALAQLYALENCTQSSAAYCSKPIKRICSNNISTASTKRSE